VTGFVEHTVPIALLVSYRHRTDFRTAIEEAISLGGDTDTVAAIVGGIVGAHVGREEIPLEWLTGIADPGWSIVRLAGIAEGTSGAPPFPLIVVRNLILLGIVLWHGFRRLIP
jgi:ADP-ribosyl-[dinitrogen reductase] hydrolase